MHKVSISRRAERERWPFEERATRGGRQRHYPIATLPRDVQVALAARFVTEIPAPPPAPELSQEQLQAELEALAILYEQKTAREKARAERSLEIVNAFHSLKWSGYTVASAMAAVCSRFGVDRATVARLRAIVRGEPEARWLYLLAPQYARRGLRCEVPADAWQALVADYMRPERPAAAACVNRLKEVAPERGWALPSDRTLRAMLAALPRTAQVLAREGKKALQALYPPQVRDKAALSALEIVNGDGYKHNVWVEFPDGDIVRAKTWYWQDVFSGKVLAWRTDKSEHTEMIRLALADLVEGYGIPCAILQDNTLAAANKTMSGGIRHRFRFKVREDEGDGVFKLLGIKVMWATPGHGQAKPVERAFGVGGIGEYVDKSPECAGAWTGASPLDKPEYNGKGAVVKLAVLDEVIRREIAAWNARPGRRSPIAAGRSFDEVFAASFEATAIRRASGEQRRLFLLATEPVKTHRKDGSIALATGRIARTHIAPTQSNRYWAPPMIEWAGKSVVARFDPQRLHEGVHVYTADGRYICFAECHAPVGFNDANAAREHARDRRSFMKAQQQILDSERRMDIREAAKHLSREARPAAELSIPAPKVVRGHFRQALELPPVVVPEMTEEERVAMAAFEERLSAPQQRPRAQVHTLRSEEERYDYWLELDGRRTAGEPLTEEDERFHAHFQTTPYWRRAQQMNADFEARLASRAS
jgi:transposase InsO family protein